jgi:hypothetical protein
MATSPRPKRSQNYLQFLQSRAESKKEVQAVEVGSDQQIRLRYEPSNYPTFHTRILAVNGVVWGGERKPLQHILSDPMSKALINENLYCVAMCVSYGPFSYFAGGDLLNHTCDGAYPYLDIETPVARTAGRTEVASANHHGYFDACGPRFTQNLDSQVVTICFLSFIFIFIIYLLAEYQLQIHGAFPSQARLPGGALFVLCLGGPHPTIESRIPTTY